MAGYERHAAHLFAGCLGQLRHPSATGLGSGPARIPRRRYSTDICRRYGLSRSTFHARAAREGWRRRDQPERTVTPYIAVTGDLDEASFFDLSEMAALRLRQAILSGRPADATGWLGLVRALRHESEYHDPGPEWFQDGSDLDSLDKLDSPDSSPDQPENPP